MQISLVVSFCPVFVLTDHGSSAQFRRPWASLLLPTVTGYSPCPPQEASTSRTYFRRCSQRFTSSGFPWTYFGFSLCFPHWECPVPPQPCSQQPLSGETFSFWDMSLLELSDLYYHLDPFRTPYFFPEYAHDFWHRLVGQKQTWTISTHNLEFVGIIWTPASLKTCGFLHYLCFSGLQGWRLQITNQCPLRGGSDYTHLIDKDTGMQKNHTLFPETYS